MEGTVTTAQAAQRLGVSPQAIALMVKRGALEPAFKLPGIRGAFLFEEASIEAKRQEGNSDE